MTCVDKLDISTLDQHADRFEFYKRVMKSVWPSKHITVPAKPSHLKLGTVDKWDHTEVSVRDHCNDVKSFIDKGLRLGHINTIAEYAVVLLDSVTVPSLRDWHRLHADNYLENGELIPSKLLWELLVNFHDVNSERNSLHKLQQLQPHPDLLQFVAQFNALSVCVSADYLTDKGRCDLFITKLPEDLVLRYELVRRLEFDAWSLSRLQQEVASSVHSGHVGGHTTTMRKGQGRVDFSLDAQGDTNMSALNVKEIVSKAVINAIASYEQNKDKGGGKKKPTCNYFAAGRHCPFGAKCRFEHVVDTKAGLHVVSHTTCERCGGVGHNHTTCSSPPNGGANA